LAQAGPAAVAMVAEAMASTVRKRDEAGRPVSDADGQPVFVPSPIEPTVRIRAAIAILREQREYATVAGLEERIASLEALLGGAE
jgi:hypothetical protein